MSVANKKKNNFTIEDEDGIIEGCCNDKGVSCITTLCCSSFIPAALASYRSKKFFACAVFVCVFLFLLGLNIWWTIDPPGADVVEEREQTLSKLKRTCHYHPGSHKTYPKDSTCGDLLRRYQDELLQAEMTAVLSVAVLLIVWSVIIYMYCTLAKIRTNILYRRGERRERDCLEISAIICCCMPCFAAQMMRWTNGSYDIPKKPQGGKYNPNSGVVELYSDVATVDMELTNCEKSEDEVFLV